METPTRENAQFGRALDELDVELICANSPQAKGRVERVNATLQDRLVKELRLRNITTIDVANLYLNEYIEEHNRRFARAPRTTFDAHRVLGPEHNLARILALRYRRTIGANGIVSYENRLFAVDYRQVKSLTSRVVEVRVQEGRVFIEQGEAALRFAEVPAPERPARPAIVERTDERLPNPNKAHPPPKYHPWNTPANALARRPKGTSLTSSSGT